MIDCLPIKFHFSSNKTSQIGPRPMKKILLILGTVLVILIGLTYWSVSGTPKKFDKCQILGLGDIDENDFKNHDSVVVAASTLYDGNDLKKFMQGEQYRETWVTPLHGDQIISKITQRRDDLPTYAKRFKEILNELELLAEPLTGSEDMKFNKNQLACFECFK